MPLLSETKEVEGERAGTELRRTRQSMELLASMNETALLYALSTLAQTCAALAAFVGAVGIFRLQALRDGRRQAEHELRLQMNRNASITDADVMATPDLLPAIQHARATYGTTALPRLPSVEAARDRWVAFDRPLSSSRTALFIFEAWNLLVIGVSLVGFSYVPVLMCTPWTFWSLWVAAVGTVGVTGYCVYAWTRE